MEERMGDERKDKQGYMQGREREEGIYERIDI